MVRIFSKKSSGRKGKKMARTYIYNRNSKETKVGGVSQKMGSDIMDLDQEEDKILKDFQTMENRLKGLKNIQKIQEIKNVGVTGTVEKAVIKSHPDKKPRKTFTGCAVKSKTMIYENVDQDEYLEVKKVYRKCPKKN
jgi:hypothetical protein